MTENSASQPSDFSNLRKHEPRQSFAQTARNFLTAEQRRREAKKERHALALEQAQNQGRQL
ncbi:hypothetical protein [Rhizobium sp. BE258]|uniref:hypothetical protein n=1 Tax=Rhizobium sp. BE258 TaxID=2817722 RepID=UPI0028658CF6|nr:hypothetical protein [Rhizobium sp. BE258]MDR7145351.1 hypothetical protein [Rhizobium sp. BE258]